jgi:putative glutamine amidotransferase
MIGILGRLDYTPSGKEAFIIYKSLVDMVLNYGINVIGIIPDQLDKIKNIIDMCDGIILSGGSNESEYDYEIIKYIYDNNIPCLGICMGMQEMCMLYGGKIIDIDNHHSDLEYAHEVVLYGSRIYDDKIIKVNSRHNSSIVKTDLNIVGKSVDRVVEMVEDKYKKFFVGVQWHPENLYMIDPDAKVLIDAFISSLK